MQSSGIPLIGHCKFSGYGMVCWLHYKNFAHSSLQKKKPKNLSDKNNWTLMVMVDFQAEIISLTKKRRHTRNGKQSNEFVHILNMFGLVSLK